MCFNEMSLLLLLDLFIDGAWRSYIHLKKQVLFVENYLVLKTILDEREACETS